MKRAALATSLLCVSAAVHAADLSAEFVIPAGIKVRIVEVPFDETPIRYDPREPCLVDGKVPFGVDCTKPNTAVKRITVTLNGKDVDLDPSGMYNAWEGRPLQTKPDRKTKRSFRYFGGRCTAPELCLFRGVFSDGAGTFVAEWLVVAGASQRTVLTSSDDVVSQIMRNVDGRQ